MNLEDDMTVRFEKETECSACLGYGSRGPDGNACTVCFGTGRVHVIRTIEFTELVDEIRRRIKEGEG